MYGHGLAVASCSHETLPRRLTAALGQHILTLYGEPAPSASARERVGPVQCKTPLTRGEITRKGLCLQNAGHRAYCSRLPVIPSPEMSQ